MPVQIGEKASSFEDPIALMSECHRRIEMFLHSLRIAASLHGRALTSEEKRSLEAALRYFRQSAPRHSADEEDSLFPRLRMAGAPAARPILENLEKLESEHRWAEPLHQEVEVLGNLWLKQDFLDESDCRRFGSLIDELSSMYRAHIEFEDRALFPLAQASLSPAQKHEIGREMARRREI